MRGLRGGWDGALWVLSEKTSAAAVVQSPTDQDVTSTRDKGFWSFSNMSSSGGYELTLRKRDIGFRADGGDEVFCDFGITQAEPA